MNLFELFVKISADTEDAEKGIERMKERGGALQSVFSGLGSVVSGFGAAAATAVSATATAVGSLMKQSIEAYSKMEQLVGGTRLLYGDAAQWIEDRASRAYKNVQMSSADYLQQVNAFATGLKVSLNNDEQAAAELADRIVTAQADIVAATGASQEMVSNAFVGLMRNNYTMLDNLQLGITPTKEGMEDLIKTINKYNREQGKATNYQMGNLADMQSAIIDYIDMQGLAGYAAMEGATTIEGATASMKAAWQDLISGISDPDKNVGELVGNFAESITNVADLILPKIQQALPKISKGIATMIKKLAPQLVSIASETAPAMIDSIVAMIETAADNLPDLLNIAEKLIGSLGEAIMQALPALGTIAGGIIESLTQALPELGTLAGEIITQLGDYLVDNTGNLLSSATEILGVLVGGMINAIPQIGTMLEELLDNLFGEGGFLSADNIANIASKGVEMLVHLADNLTEAATKIVEKLPKLIEDLITGLTTGDNLAKLVNGGVTLIETLFSDGLKLAAALADAAGKIIPDLLNAITDPKFLKALQEGGNKLVEDLFSGDWDNTIFAAATRIVKGLVEGVFNAMGNITATIFGYESKEDFEFGTAMNIRDTLGLSTGAQAQQGWEDYWGLNSKLGDQSQYMASMNLNPYAAPGMNGSYIITQNNTFDSTASPSEIKARTRAALEGALAR